MAEDVIAQALPPGGNPAPVGRPPAQPKVSTAPGPTADGVAGKLDQATTSAMGDISALQNSVSQITSDFHNSLNELKSQAPKAPELKPFEAPEQINPLRAFGSQAGLFAGLASLFTRAPLTTSLNALSSGMKSINDGNALEYQRAYQTWKDNTDYAFKTFSAQSQAYDKLMELAKTDYDGAINGMKQLAALTDDKPALLAAEMKGLQGVEELHIERGRLANESEANAFKIGIPMQILNRSINEFKVKNGRDPNSEELSNLYQTAVVGGTGGMQSTAQMIASYQIPMPTGYALKNMGGDALVQTVRLMNPDYNAARYGAIQNAYKDFTSGARSKLITSGNVAIQHLSLLREAFNAMQNGNITAINAAKAKWRQQTGSELPTNYEAVAGIAADELVKFIVGGGRSGGALADREEMKNTLSKAMSQGQGDGAFNMYIGLMAGQLNGQRKQYEADDLTQIKPFDSFLMPETISALEGHGGGDNSGSGGFVNGQIYTDANGNRAKYDNGKWIPQ